MIFSCFLPDYKFQNIFLPFLLLFYTSCQWMRVHCFCPVEKMFCNELVCNYRLINAASAQACPQLLLAYVSRVRALTGDLSFGFFCNYRFRLLFWFSHVCVLPNNTYRQTICFVVQEYAFFLEGF